MSVFRYLDRIQANKFNPLWKPGSFFSAWRLSQRIEYFKIRHDRGSEFSWRATIKKRISLWLSYYLICYSSRYSVSDTDYFGTCKAIGKLKNAKLVMHNRDFMVECICLHHKIKRTGIWKSMNLAVKSF